MEYRVIAYHGTSAEAAKEICRDGFHVTGSYESRLPNYFGAGAYFYENDEQSAWWWVLDRSSSAISETEAVVIEAEIDVLGFLDLTTGKGQDIYKSFIENLLSIDVWRKKFTEFRRKHPKKIDAFLLGVMNKFTEHGLSGIRAIIVRGKQGFSDNVERLNVNHTANGETVAVNFSRVVENLDLIVVVRESERIQVEEVRHEDPRTTG